RSMYMRNLGTTLLRSRAYFRVVSTLFTVLVAGLVLSQLADGQGASATSPQTSQPQPQTATPAEQGPSTNAPPPSPWPVNPPPAKPGTSTKPATGQQGQGTQ